MNFRIDFEGFEMRISCFGDFYHVFRDFYLYFFEILRKIENLFFQNFIGRNQNIAQGKRYFGGVLALKVSRKTFDLVWGNTY